jgi:predicted metallopeptidase
MDGDFDRVDDFEGDGAFDFTRHMRHLCVQLATRLRELAHIDVDRVAIRFCQARKAVRHGIQATLTPLRFDGGERVRRIRGRDWTIERVVGADGREMLYLLSFYLPRFLERSFEEKLTTVVHELWHISPAFNGGFRRHQGRCWAHTHSKAQYDAHAHALAMKWLALDPPRECYEFLHLNFRQLAERHGRIVGQRIRTPRLVRASVASLRARGQRDFD